MLLLALLPLLPCPLPLPQESHAAGAPRVAPGEEPAPEPAPWEDVVAWMRAQAEVFAADLERAHTALTARAEREAPELLEQLSPSPAAVRPHGYGILPPLLEDLAPLDPDALPDPRERTYSLDHISTAYAKRIRDAAVLAERVERGEGDLAAQVAAYESLAAAHSQMQEHVSYHAFWQRNVAEEPGLYAKRGATLTAAREWWQARQNGAPPEDLEARFRTIEEGLERFAPVEGLAAVAHPDGGLLLPVTVWTDIDDEEFLAAFHGAVVAAFDAPAMHARGLRLELTFARLSPAELYPPDLFPEGPPQPGEPLDGDAHDARFPPGLVLTTGAKTTHAYPGRSIRLGPDPVRPRTLAHEFCHLLGFRDAYLRAHRGDPSGPFGCVLVEWQGLFTDLLGSSARGHVGEWMVDQLVRAYGPAGPGEVEDPR